MILLLTNKVVHSGPGFLIPTWIRILYPGIGEKPDIKMLFWQFSTWPDIYGLLKKMQDLHFNVWLFSNPVDKFLILFESRGQICPIVSYFFRHCPLNWWSTLHWNVCSAFFQQPWNTWSCWKIDGPTFECMVVLQSRGQDLKCCWNLIQLGYHITTLLVYSLTIFEMLGLG